MFTQNNETNILLDKLIFCRTCNRMQLRILYAFNFYDLKSGVELVRNVKICEMCGTIHFFENDRTSYPTSSDLYIIKHFDTKTGIVDYERIEAKLNKSLFYDCGEMFLEPGTSIFNRNNMSKKFRKYKKRIFDGQIHYEESDDNDANEIVIEPAKPKKTFKLLENNHTIQIKGNLARFTL